MKKINISIVSMLFLWLSGCTTLADSIAARGTGEVRTYNASHEQVWLKTLNIINHKSLDLISANKGNNTILAQGAISAFSYGENVAIFITSINAKRTRIEIVNKRASTTNISATNWAKYIFKTLDKFF
jgi:uncharacterized protein YceK